MLLGLDARGG